MSLADYRDRWLVLIFYPRDFSMVCPTELTALATQLGEFNNRDCDLLGVSTDSIESHQQWIAMRAAKGAWADCRFHWRAIKRGQRRKPTASICRSSICRCEDCSSSIPTACCNIRSFTISASAAGPTKSLCVDGLQSGGLCPESWTRDEPTIDPALALGPSSVLGQYRIEKQLGAGTYAVVFQALDQLLQRSVALKVFRPRTPSAPGDCWKRPGGGGPQSSERLYRILGQRERRR